MDLKVLTWLTEGHQCLRPRHVYGKDITKCYGLVGVLLTSLVLTPCGVTSFVAAITATPVKASIGASACLAKDLTIHGGRQGEAQSAEGTVVVDQVVANVGAVTGVVSP